MELMRPVIVVFLGKKGIILNMYDDYCGSCGMKWNDNQIRNGDCCSHPIKNSDIPNDNWLDED